MKIGEKLEELLKEDQAMVTHIKESRNIVESNKRLSLPLSSKFLRVKMTELDAAGRGFLQPKLWGLILFYFFR